MAIENALAAGIAVTFGHLLRYRISAFLATLVSTRCDSAGAALLIATLCAGAPFAPFAHYAIDAFIWIIGAWLFSTAFRATQLQWALRATVHWRLSDVANPVPLASSTG